MRLRGFDGSRVSASTDGPTSGDGARELPLKAERGVVWKMKGPLKDSREEPLDLLI